MINRVLNLTNNLKQILYMRILQLIRTKLDKLLFNKKKNNYKFFCVIIFYLSLCP